MAAISDGHSLFGMKTEPNRTELFIKFKIIELNQTVCILN